jgi:hypothetical protein
MATQLSPDVLVGRFSGHLCFHDDPFVLERLERAAKRDGASTAAIVRSAVRMWLSAHEEER